MKNFFFAVAALCVASAITSCGGGWTEESKKSINESCVTMMERVYPDDAKTICDCYVNKLAEKYPKNDMTTDQKTAVMDECSADAKKRADDIIEKEMDKVLNAGDTTATEVPTDAPVESH
ncbi:MAG: hypothetical protein K1X54_07105 [Flavobacteriales bacterium]|nr:hypothetical protein [Flavobacteriales bacterium]